MSYDVWLEIDTGAGHMHEVYEWNYTNNVSQMWRTAGADLAEFDGKLAGDCAPILFRAIMELEGNPIRYSKMNPPNGWGSYASLVPRLRDLATAMSCHPSTTVRVSS